MKSVVICGSRRFKKEIIEFEYRLKDLGVVVFAPILFESKTDISKEVSDQTRHLRRCGVTYHHLHQVRKADVCYIYNKDHYIGNSTTLEMGIALALNKPIYAYETDTEDPPRGVIIDEIIKTPEELIKRL